jgi:hypothetical protein
MLHLPPDMLTLLGLFAPLFSRGVFQCVPVLLVGAILAPGKRTVTAILRVMGKADYPCFQNYHRVLSRARWSSRQAAAILLRLLVQTFVPTGPILMGIDETLERRRGAKIAAKGVYRDHARSSKSCITKASGLRWISLMLLIELPWVGRVWALPFFTVLAPSERYHQERGGRHKTLADWARQMLLQVRRWLPDRPLVVVADCSYAVLTLLARCARLAQPVTIVTRLRLDAGLYEPAPERQPGAIGRPRVKGRRLPTLEVVRDDPKTDWRPITVPRWYSQGERTVEIVSNTAVWYHTGMPVVPIRWVLIRDPHGKFPTQALLSTDLEATPEQILSWFVQRWQLETTFQAVRTHLGVETQRQWSPWAILRTTPVLLGLFSVVTWLAHQQQADHRRPVRQAAWYVKEQPTFSDALAWVRRDLWNHVLFCTLSPRTEGRKLQELLLQRFADTLCYAA